MGQVLRLGELRLATRQRSLGPHPLGDVLGDREDRSDRPVHAVERRDAQGVDAVGNRHIKSHGLACEGAAVRPLHHRHHLRWVQLGERLADHPLRRQADLREATAGRHDVAEVRVEDANRAVREAVQQVLQHLLRLADGLVGPLALGDVDRQADRPHGDPVSIGQRLDVRQVGPRPPIVLEDGRPAAQRSLVGVRRGTADGLRPEHDGQRQRGRARRVDVDGRHAAAGERGDAELGIRRPEHDRHLLGQRPQTRPVVRPVDRALPAVPTQ
jgi:hypothetical protein